MGSVKPVWRRVSQELEGLRSQGLYRARRTLEGPQGVNVNCIAPGFLKTEMNEAIMANPDFVAWVEGRTPLRRWAEPAEIGGAAVFLSAPAGSYVNGHLLAVDGGMISAL